MRSIRAFTLIELMIVIIILGLLAALAIPGYREYVYSAKLAEGYVGVAAVNKAQIIYFNENKHFVSTGISPFAAACTPPIRTKFPLTAFSTWSEIGSPLVDGGENYFSYATNTDHWDNAGDPAFPEWSGSVGIGHICDSDGNKPDLCSDYDDVINPEAYGLIAAPSRSFALTHATASIKGIPETCSFIIQTIIANGSDMVTSPMVTFKE
jgi:prepilin-type N-terminal cleavage/methylation domain-containing protein